MSFKTNILGYGALILAIAYVAYRINLEPSWIFGIAGLLVGLGVIGGFQNGHHHHPE